MDITYQLMIPMLQWIHAFTHSYGLSIIALTLLVRIIVWPLVGASTKNMKRMQQLQPKMKAIQDRYKDGDPEILQKKVMEFYSRNKVNPVTGCLPMIIQLPLLFALFGTFNGPPFGDRAVDVKVTCIEAQEAAKEPNKLHRNETSGSNSPYVSPTGMVGKVIVFPGESTVSEGQSIDFATRAVEGELPADFKVMWIVRSGANPAHTDQAIIDDKGHATFYKKGEYRVEGVVNGIAKQDSFGFITSLGKKPYGMALFKPENWDQVFLIVFFGVSMYFSSKISMAGTTKPEDMDENQRVQADTMKWLPLGMTVSFFLMPLPTGVYLYMVVSNIVQTFQTWLFMQGPVEPLIDPDEEAGLVPPSPTPGSTNKSPKNSNGAGKTIDIGPAPKNGKTDSGAKLKIDQPDPVGEGAEKRKPTKKKKKK
jgi:YidC/Oxa1 family membrane protein insertase